MTDLLVENGAVCGVRVNGAEEVPTDTVVLAPGHGAADTLQSLLRHGVPMEAKPLAVGFRIEHAQDLIDRAQYGRWAGHPRLGPADYRLTFRDSRSGRGVYTFCMCPGGEVIAANPDPEAIVVNGMSAYGRDSGYANSGVVVAVGPGDFGDQGPLAGLEFLRSIERRAYRMGGGRYVAPAQRVSDFLKDRGSTTLPRVSYRPGVVPSNLQGLLPAYVAESLRNALKSWQRKIPGFVSEEAVVVGAETRTSSPVRILRGDDFASPGLRGLYPVGEGAGHAGGIVSSALDGVQCIHALLKRKGMDKHEAEV